MALLSNHQTHAQCSRLNNLASVATSSDFVTDLARKQILLPYQHQHHQQQQQQLQQQQQQRPEIQQQDLKKHEQQHLPQQQHNAHYITEPSPVDVLLGRGGRSNHHAGNERFRQLIRSNRPRYNELPKHEKIKLSRAIVRAMEDLGGRFLEPADGQQYYVVASHKRAVEKTSQCLREKRVDPAAGSPTSIAAVAIKKAATTSAAPSPTNNKNELDDGTHPDSPNQVGTTSKAA